MNDNRSEPSMCGRRVLVVEDELLVRMELEAFLDQKGIEVVGPTASAKAALHLLAFEDIDAAVIDLNLRGELSTPLAAALAERGIPFVVVSGYRAEDYRYPPLDTAEWISKPVEDEALLRALRRMFAKSRLESLR